LTEPLAIETLLRMLIGDYRIEIVPDTEFRLDGGAMFGIVPKVIWEKICPPDELNRVKLQANCLFVETSREKILIETGMGEKWNEKQVKRYGIFRQKSFAQTLKEKTGYTPEEITIVINTHLHFDHAGGNTIFDEHGNIVPQFPNARYFVSASELAKAENPHEREHASYLAENWSVLKRTGQLELKPDEYEAVEGVTLKRICGHSETMQTVQINRGGETLYGFSDLIPTTAHLQYAWIMSYDLFPTETLAFKKEILPKAVSGNWICWFYHDFTMPLCRLKSENGKFQPVRCEN
jgi:glyoxylase-like metal-dependent hydrolase (beta-lactamase superfamily II)